MDNRMLNTIKGALYGVAVGDALGAPVEFMSAAEIERKHGGITEMIGGGWLNVKPGEITDDTQMTLCVARGIIRNPADPVEAVGYHFINWINGGPKDVGGTCSSSIRRAIAYGAKAGREWLPMDTHWELASEDTDKALSGRSGGNGSLMRTVYPALYYTDDAEIREKAAAISKMTHWAEEATEACELYCSIIGSMLRRRKADKYGIFHKAISESEYKEALKDDFTPHPTGYVKDSLAAAVWAIANGATFRTSVENAVNLGGDADTIGAITGGMAGAIFGYDEIPETWINALDERVRTELDALTEAAIAAREHRLDRKHSV